VIKVRKIRLAKKYTIFCVQRGVCVYFCAVIDTFPEFTYTLDSIDEVAKLFWQHVKDRYVFTFSGEMGAGKTTFIHKLCDHLDVQDVVSSPTFALINEYHFPANGQDNVIYHLDWYRLRDSEEAINAGMEDCILQATRNEARCFIEWPGKARELLPATYVAVSIENITETTRKMTINVIGK
jgi:tRNA threonylcarbamoyladenosine biosynthesis protein TsaE